MNSQVPMLLGCLIEIAELRRLNDVASLLREKSTHRTDNAGAIRAGEGEDEAGRRDGGHEGSRQCSSGKPHSAARGVMQR